MGFTLEQFKEWVAATFPNNTARGIDENDFRDGLNKMAEFSVESIGLAAEQVEIASSFADDASEAKNIAILNAEISAVTGPKYTTEALGRAAVANGISFLVQGSGDVAAYEYRRTDASNSVLIASYPSAAYIDKIFAKASLYENITEAFAAQSFNGGVANATTKTITIPNGQTGVSSMIYKGLLLANHAEFATVGTIVRFTILVTESVSGLTATKMVGAMTVNRSGSFLNSQHFARTFEYVNATTMKVQVYYLVQSGDIELRPNITILGPSNASGVDMVFTVKDMYLDVTNVVLETNQLTEKIKALTTLIHTFDDTLTVANIEEGVDIFTNTGYYINKTTGLPVADASYKYSKFIPVKDSKTFFVKNLHTAGAFRQAQFYSAKDFTTSVGNYSDDDNTSVDFNEANVPATARYMVLNTQLAKTPVLSYLRKKYRALPPVDINSAHWSTINATTGYSANYGRYWNGSAWVNSDDFSGLIYPVVAGKIIHIVGNFYGNLPIVAFFSNVTLATHIANGSQNGTTSNAYYDFKLTVPASATYALVQQARRLDLVQPFTELVAETTEVIEKRKIVLVGDSFTQMGGYADYLAKLIKAVAPEYDIFNYGIGGEKTFEIAGRMGRMKMILNPGNTYTTADSNNGKRYFELPATTSTVALGPTPIKSGWDNSTSLALLLQNTPTKDCEPKYVMVNGIQCLLTYSAPNYFLNRVVAGSGIHRVYVGSEMVAYNLPKITSNDCVIFGFGQNNTAGTDQELIDQYKQFTQNIGTDKLIVLSSHYAQTGNNAILSYTSRRDAQEALLMKEYGAKYINMREYFCGRAYLDALESGWWNANNYPTDVGIEAHPTAADILEMSNGRYAPMFWPNPNNGADIIHLARRTYQIFYTKIFQRMVSLKYL